MIFYLGHKVESVIDDKTRIARNKAKSWKYGYDQSIDTIIISKDGTLGEIYNVNGLNIGFPQKPEHKQIINWDKTASNQKWVREPLPEGLNVETQFQAKYKDYIELQFKRRDEGIWIYLNGVAVYMTGNYYQFIQWYNETGSYPNLRIIQSELEMYWEACVADERCYGIDYVKNRRFGWSALCNNNQLNDGTFYENKILGIISKKGNDAKKMFVRLVRAFKKYPSFFMPVWDGNTTPKTELVFSEPSKKRKIGEKAVEGEGLDTIISWHNTELNAMDGEQIFRSSVDEGGKWPKDVPFSEYWQILKTAHRLGSNIVGKSRVGSTVNAMKKGGSEFKKVYVDSDPKERNKNGQTKSGLYRLFIDAAYCLEGFFDVFGFSIFEDPKEPTLNDLGKYITIGADTFLKNELESLKNDPEKYNEFLRQFPRSDRDAFRDEATDCSFNLMKIMEQMDHNDNDAEDFAIETGNLTWKDGIQDTEVIWRPDLNGRFWIARGCHPLEEFKNKKEMKVINGVSAFAPLATHIGCIGIDPYNRSKTVDSRGSLGSAHLSTKFNTSHLPNNAFIVEYIDRPRTVELFFEDMIMLAHYYSMPFLCELSNERFLSVVKQRGYRHFSMNNPFKLFKDLSSTEAEFGGAPPQDTKIGDQQYYAIETYIEDYVGLAREEGNRNIGDMGFMPFNRTLEQWKDVDPQQRTKYDAYISSSLSLLGNQRRTITAPVEIRKRTIVFDKYDNSGEYSKRL